MWFSQNNMLHLFILVATEGYEEQQQQQMLVCRRFIFRAILAIIGRRSESWIWYIANTKIFSIIRIQHNDDAFNACWKLRNKN